MNNIDKEDLIESFFDRQLFEEQKEDFKNFSPFLPKLVVFDQQKTKASPKQTVLK
jgi:hypothetical protein